MKLHYFISLVIVGFLTGCADEKPEMFVDTHFVKFQFCQPNVEEYYRIDYTFSIEDDAVINHEIVVPVEFMGRDLMRELRFAVAVDKEKTTLPADGYDLQLEQPFRVGVGNVDSMRVKLLRKPILKEEEKMLRLRLVASPDFQVYMPDSLFIEIHVSDIFTRPAWWDASVEKAYLGTYSRRKYDEFVKETGIRDFGALGPSEKRQYSILFKRALEKEPRKDEDGSLMTVTIPG